MQAGIGRWTYNAFCGLSLTGIVSNSRRRAKRKARRKIGSKIGARSKGRLRRMALFGSTAIPEFREHYPTEHVRARSGYYQVLP